jgi:creatinine amidohydrolase
MLTAWLLAALLAASGGRVLNLENLTAPELDALDREATVFLLTFGNLEAHGPYLPVGSDLFLATGLRDRVVAEVRKRQPERDLVLVPLFPLGEGGANDFAGQPDHVGTFAVRFETLRNVAIDLGASIARKGFRNILLVHLHANPLHSVAFTHAATYVSERYRVRMLNLTSLIMGRGIYAEEVMHRHLGEGWQQQAGFDTHSGAAETSAILHLRPELVKPGYRDAPAFKVKDWAEVLRTAERKDWPGYWGAPSLATAAIGEELMDRFAELGVSLALAALAGEDLSALPVFPESPTPTPEMKAFVESLRERYARETAAIEAWLRAHEQK